MKQIKRLAASASYTTETTDGVPTVTVTQFDGGQFDLAPFIDDDAVILPSSDTAAYGLRIQGDPEVLGRLGKALLSVQRKAKGESDDES